MGSFKARGLNQRMLFGLVMLGLQPKDLVEFARLISDDPNNWRFVVIDLKLDFLFTAIAVATVVSFICWITGLSSGSGRSSAIS